MVEGFWDPLTPLLTTRGTPPLTPTLRERSSHSRVRAFSVRPSHTHKGGARSAQSWRRSTDADPLCLSTGAQLVRTTMDLAAPPCFLASRGQVELTSCMLMPTAPHACGLMDAVGSGFAGVLQLTRRCDIAPLAGCMSLL